MMIIFFIEMIVAFFLGVFSKIKGMGKRDCFLLGVVIFTVGILVEPVFLGIDLVFSAPLILNGLSVVYFFLGWLIGNPLGNKTKEENIV